MGSGAGGATAARELARAGHQVTILEAGGRFTPFGGDLKRLARLRATRLFLDERMIRALFPSMRVTMSAGHLPLVCGRATGGTTTLTAGNALRVDDAMSEAGLDLTTEYDELAGLIPITTDHRDRWRESTRQLFGACAGLGLDPALMPKLVDLSRCRRCGRCILGCSNGAKWDARRFLADAELADAAVIAGAPVERLALDDGRAAGVVVRRRGRREHIPADVVVLAAGGLGTPAILERSGVGTEPRLAVDPVLCVAGRRPGARQDEELSMPFFVEREGYCIAPYFDYLSFFFDRRWRLPAADILPLMIKLADQSQGRVTARETRKGLTSRDRARLREAIEVCRAVLVNVGVDDGDIFLGAVNAGHPGGTLPLTEASAGQMRDCRLPRNVYVADASLLPHALGKPPSLTIMALALRVARAVVAGA